MDGSKHGSDQVWPLYPLVHKETYKREMYLLLYTVTLRMEDLPLCECTVQVSLDKSDYDKSDPR